MHTNLFKILCFSYQGESRDIVYQRICLFLWLIFAQHGLLEIQLTVYSALSRLTDLGNVWHNLMWNMAVNNISYPIYPLSTGNWERIHHQNDTFLFLFSIYWREYIIFQLPALQHFVCLPVCARWVRQQSVLFIWSVGFISFYFSAPSNVTLCEFHRCVLGGLWQKSILFMHWRLYFYVRNFVDFYGVHVRVRQQSALLIPRGGGRITCHDFGYGHAARVPEPHPIHILGQLKNMTHSYTSHIENCPHSYPFFQIDPIHILFGWKIPHWYTFDVKMISVHILAGLKSIPLPAAHLHIPL